MQEIQATCATLARHHDGVVSKLAVQIADADLRRDTEHENKSVQMEAALSTLSARNKVLQSDNRRLKAQNNKFRDMLFGLSSEKGDSGNDPKNPEVGKTAPSQQKNNQNNPSGAATENDPAPKPKPRGMGGRKKIEIPSHLPRDKRVIEPKNGTICTCGCGMRRIGEQIIERLTYKPAEVRVIEEHYPKYTCRSCDRFVQAHVPKRAFDYTRYETETCRVILQADPIKNGGITT